MDQSTIAMIIAAVVTATATIVAAWIMRPRNTRPVTASRPKPRKRRREDVVILPFPVGNPTAIPSMEFVAAWVAFVAMHQPSIDALTASLEGRGENVVYQDIAQRFPESLDVLCRRLSPNRNIRQVGSTFWEANARAFDLDRTPPASAALAAPLIANWKALSEAERNALMVRARTAIGEA